MNAESFRREQRAVAVAMLLGLAATVLVLLAALRLGNAEPVRSAFERAAAAIKIDAFVILWLALAIANVARLRFFSPADIGGSAKPDTPSDTVRNARAILQNTLEQVTLAVPVHLVLALTLTGSRPLILALALLFSVGRAFFWIGCTRGAAGRALGFALTFYPTVAGLVVALVCIAEGG